MESWGRAFQAVDRQEAMEAMVRRLDFIPSSVGGHWKVLSWEACDWIYFLECCMEAAWRRREAGSGRGTRRDEVPRSCSF